MSCCRSPQHNSAPKERYHLAYGAGRCERINRHDGFTIAVSQARYLAPIAKRSVLSDDALSILVPILEEVVGWEASQIRTFFEEHGLLIQEWDRVRADWLTIAASPAPSPPGNRAVEAK